MCGHLASTPGAGTASSYHGEPFALTRGGARIRVKARDSPEGQLVPAPQSLAVPPLLLSRRAGGHCRGQGSPWPLPQAEWRPALGLDAAGRRPST